MLGNSRSKLGISRFRNLSNPKGRSLLGPGTAIAVTNDTMLLALFITKRILLRRLRSSRRSWVFAIISKVIGRYRAMKFGWAILPTQGTGVEGSVRFLTFGSSSPNNSLYRRG